MVDSSLQHLIYGNAIIADQASEVADVLAISEQINPDDARKLIAEIPLSPLPLDDIEQSQAVAFVSINGGSEKQYVMARAHFQDTEQSLPIRQLLLFPDDVDVNNFDFDSLLALIAQPIPKFNVTNAPLEALAVQYSQSESNDKKVMIIKSLLDDMVGGDFRLLVGILGLAIQSRVVITNFPQDNAQRLSLIRGLRLLLPAISRHLLTFTTHTDSLNEFLPQISFSDSLDDSDSYRLDWQNPVIEDSVYEEVYIEYLLSIREDDVIALVEALGHCDEIAKVLIDDNPTLESILTAVALRYQMDLAVLHGDRIASDALLNALETMIPLSEELYTAYLIILLENNFEDRDATTTRAIGTLLDADTTLNSNLSPFFNTSIEKQPDAVYSFIRTYLHQYNDGNERPENWLQRLHNSATASVQVAIESGDANTIQSWVRLLSREPLRYELSDILRNAMLSAGPYVSDSSDLARELLVVAVKRQSDMINVLLTDTDFLSSLPEHISGAVIDFDSGAIEAIGTESRELFLLALHRSIEAEHASVTSANARILWHIHTQQNTNTLPLQFRPLSLIQNLADHPACFINGAYAILLTLILADGEHDALFFEIIPSFSEQDGFSDVLAGAIEQSDRNIEGIGRVLSTLVSEGYVSPQIVTTTLSTLLTNRNWQEESLPLIEQLSRVMTQYPDTDASMGVLWKLSELASLHKNEQMLKVSMRRLLENTGALLSETQVVESIQHIRKDSTWSPPGRSVLVKWWRLYVRDLGKGQLQKIEKLLEGKRSLEDLRAIVQTSLAMRRVIGNRNLAEFSEAVTTTYNLLQALSEGFDANEKLVDSTTIRDEINAREDELPDELRPVLSTNLKELAHIVTTLSENRSKPSLIRSDDTVERQLAKGEQEPHSAIDVMRWLSGYLEGIQKNDTAE